MRKRQSLNIVLENETCTTGKLRQLLLEAGIGECSTRKNLQFLAARQCSLIEVFTSPIDKKIIEFGGRSKLLYHKPISEEKLNSKIIGLLTSLQRGILHKIEKTS